MCVKEAVDTRGEDSTCHLPHRWQQHEHENLFNTRRRPALA